MSELMTIQALTMSSREIAELTGKDLSHVNRDIRAMLDALVDDPELDHVREDKDARGYTTAFHLGRELTYTLMAGYSVQLRRKVIARWQELEAAQAPDLSTDEGRLLMIQELSTKQLALVRENKVQAQQLALAAPKVEFVDKFVQASTGSKTFRQVAKLLKANEREFRAFLEDFGVMYRLGGEWMPYAQHLDADRFEVKTGVAGNEHAYTATRFTAKGVEWIAGEWAKHQVREVASAPGN